MGKSTRSAANPSPGGASTMPWNPMSRGGGGFNDASGLGMPPPPSAASSFTWTGMDQPNADGSGGYQLPPNYSAKMQGVGNDGLPNGVGTTDPGGYNNPMGGPPTLGPPPQWGGIQPVSYTGGTTLPPGQSGIEGPKMMDTGGGVGMMPPPAPTQSMGLGRRMMTSMAPRQQGAQTMPQQGWGQRLAQALGFDVPGVGNYFRGGSNWAWPNRATPTYGPNAAPYPYGPASVAAPGPPATPTGPPSPGIPGATPGAPIPTPSTPGVPTAAPAAPPTPEANATGTPYVNPYDVAGSAAQSWGQAQTLPAANAAGAPAINYAQYAGKSIDDLRRMGVMGGYNQLPVGWDWNAFNAAGGVGRPNPITGAGP